MSIEIRVPTLGESVTEATVAPLSSRKLRRLMLAFLSTIVSLLLWYLL